MKAALLVVSMLALACACWLAVMEAILRHSGFASRAGVAVALALICAAAIIVPRMELGFRLERWLWLGAAVLVGVGAQAFAHNLHAIHFEGFVLVVSLVFVLEGILIFMALGQPRTGDLRAPEGSR